MTIDSRIKNVGKIKKRNLLKTITNRDKLFFIILLSSLFIVLLSQVFDTIELNKKQREREFLYNTISEKVKNAI
jgi:hypothetical protein